MNLGPNDELFFTAVRYALEELPALERDAFEQRLLEDQQARECLVQAVRLCQVVSGELRSETWTEGVAEREKEGEKQPAIVRRHWQRGAAWASLALAASILLAVVLVGISDRQLPLADVSPSAGDKQLAVAWVNSAAIVEALRQAPETGASEPSGAMAASPDEIAALDMAAEPFSPDETTIGTGGDWLFEAITAPQPSAVPEPSTANHQEG